MFKVATEEKNTQLEYNSFFLSPATLVLKNGLRFKGLSPSWQKQSACGEVVFNTGMTGYEASLTDPSYAGQILLFTYPLIGNYGVTDQHYWESEKIHAAGAVIANLCEEWSHEKSKCSLTDWLYYQNVPVITGIDTRHVTTLLRESGTMEGIIALDPVAEDDHTIFVQKPPTFVSVAQKIQYLSHDTSITNVKKVILVDCGMKSNILRYLLKFPLEIERVPYHYDYSDETFDGVFLSNGPGNPEDYSETIRILKKAMKKERPIFGICLGAQLLALSAGAKTYKLRYGHRSHNQPCINLESKRCYITSQNHGYAILEDSLPQEWIANFKNLNDGSVEGIKHVSLPFVAVQFHPEAAPGPTDTEWFFEQFVAQL